jgi:hypothetical protein
MTGTKIGSGFRCVFANAGLALALFGCGGDGTDVTGAGLPTTSPTGASNTAPTIAGTAPTSIQAGKAYAFKPSAKDADQDKVTFVVANKPKWASFDAATGTLSGTPAAADVGKYASIEISATDGTAVASLPQFTITVAAASTALAKAVTLEWQAPTENTDGTTLADLKGYEIHYGTQSQSYSASISVTNPSVTRYVIDQLSPGKYYFAITALNGSGHQSPLSNEVATTLN